jgi:hypothetical protein
VGDRLDLHDNTVHDVLYTIITSCKICDIFLLLPVLESRNCSAMHPTFSFQNTVVIFGPETSPLENVTVSIGQLFEGKAG